MKALKILQDGIKFMEDAKETNPMSVVSLDAEIAEYEEAIQELQEFIKEEKENE